jgi:hypothetical protein
MNHEVVLLFKDSISGTAEPQGAPIPTPFVDARKNQTPNAIW